MTRTTVPAGVRTAAERLRAAQRTGEPCPPVRDLVPDSVPDSALATAYAIQSLLTRDRAAAGHRVVGRKVGLTSPAVQAQLGVDQPDFGVLFDDMACPPGVPVDIRRLLQPRIEAEVAFVLAADLDIADLDITDPARPDLDTALVRDAVDHVVPALEIVDSRIAGWDITILDTVADNASSGLFVLGETATPLGALDLREIAMTMTDGSGAVVSAGTGADCLGDPLAAVAWVARTAAGLGAPLRAGDVVLSGALGPMVPVSPGASFTASLSGLGSVTARFTTGE